MGAHTIRIVAGTIVLALSLSLYLFGSAGETYAVVLAVGMFIGFALILSGWLRI
jgi:hypothetical protein